MKKIFGLLLFVGFSYIGQAQEVSENAIGLRLEGDVEVTYQRAISDNTRLELDLGWNRKSSDLLNTFQLAGLHQWVWNIDGGFNWYAGVGGAVGGISDKLYIDAAGNIGIEYNFDVPILLSIDYRPQIGLINSNANGAFNRSSLGLSVRYQF